VCAVQKTQIGEVETLIKDQLKTLSTDVLQYGETLAGYQTALESNERLHQQLKAQYEQCKKLEDLTRHSQQEKDSLQERVLVLQSEISEWMTKVCNHKDEIESLRQQVKENEKGYKTTLEERDSANRELDDIKLQLATTKVRKPRKLK
jgi:chromosome segregation ATPase